jgi:hypothetical protein
MAENQRSNTDVPGVIEVDLRQPAVAALWAWILPGAGHFYQRRYAKGVIFLVCILFTYFFGLALGGGRVVYASFRSEDFRWQYVLQLGVGAPALPALVQSYRVRQGKGTLWPHIMAPPRNVQAEFNDDLAQWHYGLHAFFELGTLYTMVAGLLNVLAIYDAYAGPLVIVNEGDRDRAPPRKGTAKNKDNTDQPAGDSAKKTKN